MNNKKDPLENLDKSAKPEGYTLLFSVLSTSPGAFLISESIPAAMLCMVIYLFVVYLFRMSMKVLYENQGVLLAVLIHGFLTLGFGIFLWDMQSHRSGPGIIWLSITIGIYFFYVTPQLRKNIARSE